MYFALFHFCVFLYKVSGPLDTFFPQASSSSAREVQPEPDSEYSETESEVVLEVGSPTPEPAGDAQPSNSWTYLINATIGPLD